MKPCLYCFHYSKIECKDQDCKCRCKRSLGGKIVKLEDLPKNIRKIFQTNSYKHSNPNVGNK